MKFLPHGLLIINGLLCAYSYFLYPFALLFLRLFRRRTYRKGPFQPRISLIIAAYNEESKIAGKLKNTLEIDYPRELLEVIVASDASSDGTDAIVRQYAGQVILSRVEERKGKEYAQKVAVGKATGELLVFSDTGTQLDRDCLHKLAANFYDPRVGAVSSTDKMVSEDGEVMGEGAYVAYEMWLRRLECQVNGLVGLSGSFFAARKVVCENWADDLQSDFNTVLNLVKQDFTAIADDEVFGYYKNIRKGQSEFSRKVRTVVRGITVFFRVTDMLNPFKYGLFAWQLFSHKLMRWTTPLFMVTFLALTLAGVAMGDSASLWLLLLQGLFYASALLVHLFPVLERFSLLKIAYYFTEVNVAILVAWKNYLLGQRIKTWEPSRR